jgi:MFS family permease
VTTVDPTPASLPAALAEPTVRVRRGWIALLFSANLGVWMAFFTPIQVLLPQQVERIAPADKETMLAWVMALGAFAAILANPLAGAFSDRTSLRLGGRELGRRHVWTVGGAVLGAVSLVVLAQQRSILGVALAWVAAQVCFNAMLASLTAAVPDRVPVLQRGAVSGWAGIPQALGLVVGAVLVTALVTGNAAGYVAIAVAVLVLALPFALLTADDHLPRAHRPAARLAELVRGMWISPRRHPDFAWAWGTRFLVQVGNALGTLYLLYFLQDGGG